MTTMAGGKVRERKKLKAMPSMHSRPKSRMGGMSVITKEEKPNTVVTAARNTAIPTVLMEVVADFPALQPVPPAHPGGHGKRCRG